MVLRTRYNSTTRHIFTIFSFILTAVRATASVFKPSRLPWWCTRSDVSSSAWPYTPARPRTTMLGYGGVRHPAGMIKKGGSRLENTLCVRVNDIHDEVSPQRATPPSRTWKHAVRQQMPVARVLSYGYRCHHYRGKSRGLS